ncbi:MAG: DNA starvation/stationary phase protection protein [Saprospiraceae bacterium]|nr:DNA starvation/stationary phase protection protein [Saprospiraceae bacterium]
MDYLNLEKKSLNPVVEELNQLLAEYHIYYQNLRRYHWHVQGSNFFDLHVKFEELYTSAQLSIDEIAERILTVRQKPIATYKEYLDMATIKEVKSVDDHKMVEHILQNHKIIIDQMRVVLDKASEAEDEGTTDIIAGFLSSLEKSSWMLDAWLAKS